jgi:hypothetical protein
MPKGLRWFPEGRIGEMSYLAAALLFANLLCAGICAGGWVVVLTSVCPARRRLAAGPAVQLHQIVTHTIDAYMRVVTAVSAVTALLLIALGLAPTASSLAFTLLGAASTVTAGYVSIRYNIPTNKKIAGWSPDDVPAEFAQLRERWDRIHAIRTACGVAALTCYIAAALLR